MKILTEEDLQVVSGGDYDSGEAAGEQAGKLVVNCLKAAVLAFAVASLLTSGAGA
jgi:bacteriocin-like protein